MAINHYGKTTSHFQTGLTFFASESKISLRKLKDSNLQGTSEGNPTLVEIVNSDANFHDNKLSLRPDFLELTFKGKFLQRQFRLALEQDNDKTLSELLERYPAMANSFLKGAELLPEKKWSLLTSAFQKLLEKGSLSPAIENIKISLEHKRSLNLESFEQTFAQTFSPS